MISKILKLVLAFSLVTLQSCSNSKIGNFLESSFQNLKESESNKNLEENKENKSNKNLEENKENESNKNLEDNKENKSNDEVKKKTEKNFSNNKSEYKPYSYRIIILLKDVDPSSPVEIFSNVLKDSNVDFEIEKIEIYQDE